MTNIYDELHELRQIINAFLEKQGYIWDSGELITTEEDKERWKHRIESVKRLTKGKKHPLPEPSNESPF